MEILHIASGTLTLFFIAMLIGKKEKSWADKILLAWFCIIFINILTFYLLSRNDMRFGFILELSDSSAFLHAPFLWFYTLALTKPNFGFKFKDSWHLVPFFISLLLFFLPTFLSGISFEYLRPYGMILKMIQLPVYFISSIWLLKKYQAELPNLFSSTEKINLDWLKILSWGLLAIWGISAVSLFLFFFVHVDISSFGGLYTNIAVSVFIFILGYFGFQQTTIFTPTHLKTEVRPTNIETVAVMPPKINSEKYSKSGLLPQQAEKIYEALLKHMEESKPYLDPQLSLLQLAASLAVPPNHVSQVINAYANQNFFDFINQYRVNAIKRQIENKVHLQQTLLAIALDCGFNSKASFNRSFKKFVNMTPSVYVKQITSN